ncbi:MAG: DUF1566 domain-containing protein [Deltaproteobacteria bacterium]|nr:DUF1566 domain-containing protein [Deltaproteobacteria bacterium]
MAVSCDAFARDPTRPVRRLPAPPALIRRELGCGGDAAVGPGADGSGGAYWPSSLGGPLFWYWSSSPYADLPLLAWMLDFRWGHVGPVTTAEAGYVRCVRPEP